MGWSTGVRVYRREYRREYVREGIRERGESVTFFDANVVRGPPDAFSITPC